MLFLMQKAVGFVAQPSSLIAIALTAGILLITTSWQRLGRGLLIGALATLVIGGLSPLGDLLIRPLENRFPRADIGAGTPPLTGIIVLGGGEDSRASPQRELAALNESAERFTEAVALARRFPGLRIVFTGGTTSRARAPEAFAAERLFEALGIDKGRLTLESASRDTYENAVLTAAIVKPKPGERWLLVTSAWHMPRAIGCFRRAGFPVEAWPVDYRTGRTFDPWRLHQGIPDGLKRIDFIMREYAGLVGYYLLGRTSALFPVP
ncbi:MAG: YdcF family protein [Hyphomicrobiaceae bacterium]|nr:MAG: YdcF family protein [Hyphomicrobiaceae bacterium]